MNWLRRILATIRIRPIDFNDGSFEPLLLNDKTIKGFTIYETESNGNLSSALFSWFRMR
jgi:hypothetical protein